MKCSICGKAYRFKYNPRKICSDACLMNERTRLGIMWYKKWVALKKKNAIIKRSLITKR
jgi:hypothetical protein